ILEAGANIDEIEAPDAKKTLESIVQVLKSGKDIPDDQVKITPIGGNAKTVRAGYGFIAQVSVDLGQGIVLDGKIKHSKKPGEIDNLLAVERAIARKGIKGVSRSFGKIRKYSLVSEFSRGHDMAHIYHKLPAQQRTSLVNDVFDTCLRISRSVREKDFEPNLFDRVVRRKKSPIGKYDAAAKFEERFLARNVDVGIETNSMRSFYQSLEGVINGDDPGLVHLDLHGNNVIVNTRRVSDSELKYVSFKIGDWDPAAITSVHMPLYRLLVTTDAFESGRADEIYDHAYEEISKDRKITRNYFDVVARLAKIHGDLRLAGSANDAYEKLRSLGEEDIQIEGRKYNVGDVRSIASYYFTRAVNILFNNFPVLGRGEFQDEETYLSYCKIRDGAKKFAEELRGLITSNQNRLDQNWAMNSNKGFAFDYLGEGDYQNIEGRLSPDKDAWRVISPLFKEKAERDGLVRSIGVVAKRIGRRNRMIDAAKIAAGLVAGAGAIVAGESILDYYYDTQHPSIGHIHPADVKYSDDHSLTTKQKSKATKDVVRHRNLRSHIGPRFSDMGDDDLRNLDSRVRDYEASVLSYCVDYGFQNPDIILAMLDIMSPSQFRKICENEDPCTAALLVNERNTLNLGYRRQSFDEKWDEDNILRLIDSFSYRVDVTGSFENALASFVLGIRGIMPDENKYDLREALFLDADSIKILTEQGKEVEALRTRVNVDNADIWGNHNFSLDKVEEFVYDVMGEYYSLKRYHTDIALRSSSQEPRKLALRYKNDRDLSRLDNTAFSFRDGSLVVTTGDRDVVYDIGKGVKPVLLNKGSNHGVSVSQVFDIDTSPIFRQGFYTSSIRYRVRLLGLQGNRTLSSDVIEGPCKTKGNPFFEPVSELLCNGIGFYDLDRTNISGNFIGYLEFTVLDRDTNFLFARNFVPAQVVIPNERALVSSDFDGPGFFVSGARVSPDESGGKVQLSVFNLNRDYILDTVIRVGIPELRLYSYVSVNPEGLSNDYGVALLPINNFRESVAQIPQGSYDLFVEARGGIERLDDYSTGLPLEVLLLDLGPTQKFMVDKDYYLTGVPRNSPSLELVKELSQNNITAAQIKNPLNIAVANFRLDGFSLGFDHENRRFYISDQKQVDLRQSCDPNDPTYHERISRLVSFSVNQKCFVTGSLADYDLGNVDCCDVKGVCYEDGKEVKRANRTYANCQKPKDDGYFVFSNKGVRYKMGVLNEGNAFEDGYYRLIIKR
ncbi:hypothetical protein J4216_05055, partial [Candidatus Woesearchaeota archaeon]|nr:hypothetical protein [Candidatus Woesearchaeota archaeon]